VEIDEEDSKTSSLHRPRLRWTRARTGEILLAVDSNTSEKVAIKSNSEASIGGAAGSRLWAPQVREPRQRRSKRQQQLEQPAAAKIDALPDSARSSSNGDEQGHNRGRRSSHHRRVVARRRSRNSRSNGSSVCVV